MTYPDGSPADGVRVRVKAELTPKDNVYTSELISKDGQATFEIPSIPTAAQYVWLEVSGSSSSSMKIILDKSYENLRVFYFLFATDQSDIHWWKDSRRPVPAKLLVYQ